MVLAPFDPIGHAPADLFTAEGCWAPVNEEAEFRIPEPLQPRLGLGGSLTELGNGGLAGSFVSRQPCGKGEAADEESGPEGSQEA